MKSETLKLVESMNNLNESRYYYGEIEEVKTNLSEIIKLVNTANNTLIDVSNNDDNDYDENQKDTLDKIEQMDDYVIRHFRIAFGNRIVSHMKKFVPVYVACGGDEIAGVDYFIAKKILRKFEQLNVAYIRDEIDPYIDFLDKTFGKNKMKECTEYLLRLKKLT